ncbi:MAG: sigma-54 dependent transcriptional regulator [Myxococcota bacterium]
MNGRVLIVDDDEAFGRSLARHLRRRGYEVSSCTTATEARKQLPADLVDVVVLDYQLPDADGLELLEELRPDAAGAAFLMATAYPSLEVAVEAMRRGAFDYVAKGGEIEECLIRIDRASEVAGLRRRVAHASKGSAATQDLVGESTPMRALRRRLELLAGADDTTVQILGETGTGKGVVARAIHAASGRAFEPFVAVDCTTIPATLVESELFGHERGAFSGATSTKMGRVEAAGKGTLFLDEIGELELPIQAKLLRLLEEREYTRVGSTRARTLEARVIAATNRDLELAVEEGRFRADLRYRLEVFVIETPALRDRGDDVMVLTGHFVATQARALGRPVPQLSESVIEGLRRYAFPGNVRELRNMVEQAMLLAQGEELTLADFPVLARDLRNVSARRTTRRPPPQPVAARLEDIRRDSSAEEHERIVEALRAQGGNVSATARELGMSRYQLNRRLKKYGLR